MDIINGLNLTSWLKTCCKTKLNVVCPIKFLVTLNRPSGCIRHWSIRIFVHFVTQEIGNLRPVALNFLQSRRTRWEHFKKEAAFRLL